MEDFQTLSERIGSNFYATNNVNSSDVVEFIDRCGVADIGVSINCVNIIKKGLIDKFANGILNGHAGDLPKYKGNAPLAWAILNEEKKIAVCIHRMVPSELDSGLIISKRILKLKHNERIENLLNWVNSQVPDLMVESVDKISKNCNFFLEDPAKKKDLGFRCYPRKPEDARIIWTKKQKEIVNLINASSEPYSGAFCYLNDNKMIIWRAELFFDKEKYFAVPGQVSEINQEKGYCTVITGKGKVKLTEVEYEGKRLFPSEIIKSIRLRLT